MTETQDTGLGALYAALAKAQGAMTAASKDHAVDFQAGGSRVKYNYATLAGVWEVCRKPLADNGLCVIQQVIAATDKSVTINTILGHSSGESICSAVTMPILGGTAQAVGSAISFARRYGMSPIVGAVTDDEDDDGQAASKKPEPPRIGTTTGSPSPAPGTGGLRSTRMEDAPVVKFPLPHPAVPAAPVLPPMADDPAVPKPLNTWIANDGQRKYFWQEAKALGFDADKVHAILDVERMGQWAGSLEAALGRLKNEAEG